MHPLPKRTASVINGRNGVHCLRHRAIPNPNRVHGVFSLCEWKVQPDHRTNHGVHGLVRTRHVLCGWCKCVHAMRCWHLRRDAGLIELHELLCWKVSVIDWIFKLRVLRGWQVLNRVESDLCLHGRLRSRQVFAHGSHRLHKLQRGEVPGAGWRAELPHVRRRGVSAQHGRDFVPPLLTGQV